MASIILDIEKGVEVAAEAALKFLTTANSKVSADGPSAIAGLAVVIGAIDKALSDAAAVSADPASLVVSFGTDVADIKAVWPAVKAFVATLGIKV